MRVWEEHGGTTGTNYVYFIRGRELIHVSQLPGVKRIKEERWGRGRRVITWYVPNELVSGGEGLVISFSSGGRYPYIYYFRLPQDVSNVKSLWDFRIEEIKDPIREIVIRRNLSFKLFGSELPQLNQYRKIVPKLVDDLWKELKSMGISDVLATEHAERLREMLKDPTFAECMSLVLPSSRGRARSLYEKTSKAYEVWLLSKVLKALYNLGAKPQSDELWISFTTNTPVAKMRYSDKFVYVFYQPSIVPHIMSMLLSSPKRVHAVPDIAIAILDEEEYIDWGRLINYADKVPLVIEAKLSLTGSTKYETIDMTISQVKTYRELLNNMPMIIVPIYYGNKLAVHRLKRVAGVEAIDNVNPDNPEKVKEFIKCVETIIKRRL
ncbi:MAG: hypothetical protein ACXQTI_03540 [Candidatus Nezhaarchaeales archaeon]